MQIKPYKNLLSQDNLPIRENGSPYLSITERHLQILWFEQKYLKPLQTLEGKPIEVLSPGIWNAEAGPDFKKAHLKIDGQDLKGDVEVHLREEDWRRHRHHLDPRYGRVVLHVFLWTSGASAESPPGTVSSFHRAALENQFHAPLQQILQLIDVELYPYLDHTGTGKCADAVFEKITPNEAQQFFASAASWRMESKARQLVHGGSKPADELIIQISGALGFKKNAGSFKELSQYLMQRRELQEEALYALALGCCGFLEGPYPKRWGGNAHYRHLNEWYLKIAADAHPRIPLDLHQIRPFNHPIRRLRYLTKLIQDPAAERITADLHTLWDQKWEAAKNKELKTFLSGLIPSYEDPYLNRHLIFGSPDSSRFLPLIGQETLERIWINCLFPLLHEHISKKQHPFELSVFFALFRDLKKENTGKAKYLSRRLFGNSSKEKILENPLYAQGAYQLHHDFCTRYEASCAGCPFIDRFYSLS